MRRGVGQALRRSVVRLVSRSERTLAWWVFGAAAFLLEARLMVPGPVGIADNSDGRRLICQFAAAPPGGWRDAVYWWHTQLVYVPGDPTCEHAYQSSQLLLLWPTRLLTTLFFHGRVLDLRILGALTVLLLAGAVALVFAAAPGRRRTRLLIAAGLVAILADSEFADYIMSPYSEPAALIGALYVVAAVLLMRKRGRTGRIGAGLFVLATAFMLCAKTQTLTMLLPLALLLFTIRIPGDEAAGRMRRIAARLGLLAAIGLIVAVYPPKATPGGLGAQTRFNLVFLQILQIDGHPAVDLKELGYPAAAAKFEGDNAWCTLLLYPNDPLAAQAQQTATYPSLARFLAAHPVTALEIMQRAAKRGFFQPQSTASFCNWPDHRLGDYPASASKGPEYDLRFTPVDSALRLLRPGGLPLLAVGWAALLALALWARRRIRDTIWADLLLFLTVGSVTQFVTAAFGDGVDVTKHLNLSVFCAAAAVLIAVPVAVGLRGARRTRAAGSVAPDPGLDDDDLSLPQPAGAN